MNYSEITQAALSFADRFDTGTIGNLNVFLRMIEAKVNRVMRAQQMELSDAILVDPDVNHFHLPLDCAEVRSVGLFTNFDTKRMQFVTLAQFSKIVADKVQPSGDISGYYTFIDDLVYVYPVSTTDAVYGIVYYAKIPPLLPTSPDDTNWLSEQYPDIYISGLVFEINAYTKNPDASSNWSERFNSALNELTEQNWLRKWPGASLVMSIEDN